MRFCSRLLAPSFVLCAVLLGLVARLHAQAADGTWLSPRISADPNGSSYGFEYRGAVRGRFSDSFELYGGEHRAGYGLTLAPMFELHEPNNSQNVLPSQYWRARLSLEQGYTIINDKRVLRFAIALTHESDHETAHPYARPGFLALNDVDFRFHYGQKHARWAWNAGLDVYVYALSCTESRTLCKNFRGDASLGGQLQAALALTGFTLGPFVPFAAVSNTGILAHGIVASERRMLGRVGGYARFGDSLFSLFLLGSVGNDIGVIRNRTLNSIGAGVSFAR